LDTKSNGENAKTKKKSIRKHLEEFFSILSALWSFFKNNSATSSIPSSSFFITRASVFRARDQQGDSKF
jgi:hypothetical protein